MLPFDPRANFASTLMFGFFSNCSKKYLLVDPKMDVELNSPGNHCKCQSMTGPGDQWLGLCVGFLWVLEDRSPSSDIGF